MPIGQGALDCKEGMGGSVARNEVVAVLGTNKPTPNVSH